MTSLNEYVFLHFKLIEFKEKHNSVLYIIMTLCRRNEVLDYVLSYKQRRQNLDWDVNLLYLEIFAKTMLL